MTVAELIEKLREMPQDAQVYSWSAPDAEPCEPTPEYADWGDPADPDRGVYL